jgi:hypothetical protein
LIAGSTFDSMLLAYFRDQRCSIYEPATIGDIPFEVIKKGLKYLDLADLLSASLSCRAWRPAAIEILLSSAGFAYNHTCYVWACGLALKSIVFDRQSFTIKSLHLELRYIGLDRVLEIARLVSSTLSILSLDFSPERIDDQFIEFPPSFLCETLETFLIHCPWIRALSLIWWGLESIPLVIKEGVSRLTRLSVERCDISMLVEHLDLKNMISFEYSSDDGSIEDDAIIENVLMKCPRITELKFNSISTDLIPKVVEYCPLLEKFTFDTWGRYSPVSLANLESIASLPRLKYLSIDSDYAVGAFSGLKCCKRLKHLSLYADDEIVDLSDVLPYIGGNLTRLVPYRTNIDTVNAIIKHCPNLAGLNVFESTIDDGALELIKREMRMRLKRLASLKIGGIRVRRA